MTTTEQTLDDIIKEQAERIAELEKERDSFKSLYSLSCEERAKLIVKLTDHVPINSVLADQRRQIAGLSTGVREILVFLEEMHRDGHIIIRNEQGEIEPIAKVRKFL